MEENIFASFTQITDFNSQSSEKLKQYYLENKLSPDNTFLKKYLNWPDTQDNPTILNSMVNSPTPSGDIGQLLGSINYTSDTPINESSNSNNGNIITEAPTKSKKEFLDKYEPWAAQAAKQYGISKHLLLAQVALETGWGKHTPGNNIGGIKANKNWQGNKQELMTTEFENGKYVKKPQSFRAYNSIEEGFKGYVDFLMSNSRYRGLKGVTDPYKAAEAMGKTGYATDPNYTAKLQNIIKQLQIP